MEPGSVAILFRNDHFSTLYRHPQTLELLTLVTDAGYAGHAEVVWESLVDVNGESAEFFSGDFRLVGGASHGQAGPSGQTVPGSWTNGSNADNGEWTTVQGTRRGRTQTARQSTSAVEPPLSPTHEQEDRDLALALQLQEEEDERARAEQERRRRESLLSEQFIEQQARGTTTAAGAANRNTPRNASHSTTSLTTSSTASSTRRGITPAQPGRPASASVSTPNVTATSTNTNTANRQRPAQQVVRSLLPPRTTSRSAAEEGLDDAPPSYEQAAKQLPYVPPAGHPSHPASSPLNSPSGGGQQAFGFGGPRSPASPGGGDGGGGYAVGGGDGGLSGVMGQQRGGRLQPQGRRAGSGAGGGFTSGGGGYPGNGATGLRRGVPPSPVPANGSGGRDRDCVVM
ncbi:hypothetical protein VTI74DRAFT_4454 [Chaetomium olivicolor]